MTIIAKRFHPRVRREMILAAAIRCAERPGGWNSLTRSAIAHEARCADGLISKYLGSMDGVRRSIMKAAIKYEYLSIIGQGMASGDKLALAASPILRHKAANCLFSTGE